MSEENLEKNNILEEIRSVNNQMIASNEKLYMQELKREVFLRVLSNMISKKDMNSKVLVEKAAKITKGILDYIDDDDELKHMLGLPSNSEVDKSDSEHSDAKSNTGSDTEPQSNFEFDYGPTLSDLDV